MADDRPSPTPFSRPPLMVPGDIPPDPNGELPWWKPRATDVLRELDVRWWLGLAATIGAVLGLFYLGLITVVLLNCHLWLPLVGALIAVVAGAIRRATRRRREPFCIHCGYTLIGLPDQHNCPECGRRYAFHLIDEYRHDPVFFIRRWRMHHRTARESAPIAAGPTRRRSRDGT